MVDVLPLPLALAIWYCSEVKEHQSLPPELIELVARRFHVLGSASRIRVVDSLMNGPLGISEIVEVTGLEQSNLSRHLKDLEQGGWVKKTRDGNSVMVEVADDTLFQICELVCGQLMRDSSDS